MALRFPEDVTLPFGLYRGDKLGDILANNPGYFHFLNSIPISSDRLREAIREMTEKYAVEIAKADPYYDGNDIPAPQKVYTFYLEGSRYLLKKDNGYKFHMKGDEGEALERAVIMAEQDGAKLDIKGLPHLKAD